MKKDTLVALGMTTLAILGVAKCTNSDWYQESERRRKADERAAATPHVIREADNCKVYAWKDNGGTGTTHYFTKCPNATVTTDRQYEVKCGKTCTRTETESVTTETH
ncbi:hypothetical protein [Burkholderia ubonensis]|uniref:hypothetical protein n=1 Tax=Burkholderia ubonensis TaxID=101571 RepID=UPI000B108002|nr:hypothetical protein [Burkholderia ubonensis]